MTKKDKKIIEDGEAKGIPIFVLTAKDMVALSTIEYYQSLCIANECPSEHVAEISLRIEDFKQFKKNNPEIMKFPD